MDRWRVTAWLRDCQQFGELAVPRWVTALGTLWLFAVLAASLAASFTAVRAGIAAVVLAPSLLGLSRPRFRLVLGALPAMAAALVLVGNDSASAALLAVYFLAGEAGYLGEGWGGFTVLLLAVAAMSGHAVHDAVDHLPTGWYLSALGSLFIWGLGRLSRRQRVTVDALRQAQAELSEQAANQERQRIARDIHDLVAHSLSVTMLHLTAARLTLDRDPERARAALNEAERIGRQSMAEIRRTVGLLPRSSGSAVAPVPGAADLDDLVEGFRRAGMDVTLDVAGSPDRIPAPTGLSVYRIVQEALTNAARHAPGEATSVMIAVDGRAVDVCVDNPLPRRRPRSDGDGGQGLAGMAERAGSAGGQLTAGPTGDHWAVSARLPLVQEAL